MNELEAVIFGKRGGGTAMSEESSTGAKSQVYESKIIAQLFGVSVRRIQQLTQEGVIETVPYKDGNRVLRRYELVPTIQKYIQYLSDKAYGKNSATEREKELKEKKMAADAELKESQAELHKLKTKIASGEYISKEEVKIDYEKFFVVFKKFASSIPSMAAGRVSAYADPTEARKLEKDLAEEINRLLTSFVVAGTTPDDGGRDAEEADPEI